MDKFHTTLIILLGISIIFLGISSVQTLPVLESNFAPIGEEPEVWSIKITPDHLNNIADTEWVARLKINSTIYISGSDLACLNICGNRCLWLGYTYKNHSVEPGSYLWGDKQNPICSCTCYIIRR